MIPDVAIGAVIAALIGAMISLAGLIVSKEAKVSEFRQAWIDKLRGELASFMTHLAALEDARLISFKTPREQFDATKESVAKLNEAYFTVALRLNLDETSSQNVQRCMVTLSAMVNEPNRNMEHFKKAKSQFIEESNALLRAEWRRVKDGEETYKSTKRNTTWVVLCSIVLVFILIGINRFSPTKKTGEGKGGTTSVQYFEGAEKSGRNLIESSSADASNMGVEKLGSRSSHDLSLTNTSSALPPASRSEDARTHRAPAPAASPTASGR